MNNIKAVIFDWAGTIVDYGSMAPVMAFVELFKKRGIEVTPNIVRLGMGLDKKEHTKVIMNHPRVISQWIEVYQRKPNKIDIDEAFYDLESILIEIVKDYAKPIKGTIELLSELRRLGIKIGSGTGYKQKMMETLVPAAENYGLKLDCVINSSDVSMGRPMPWMCYLNAMHLGVYPLSQMIKIGDTIADIEEARNADMWSIAVTLSGNEIGLSEEEQKEIPKNELDKIKEKVTKTFYEAGAHYVIDGVWDCMPILHEIDLRIANGEKP